MASIKVSISGMRIYRLENIYYKWVSQFLIIDLEILIFLDNNPGPELYMQIMSLVRFLLEFIIKRLCYMETMAEYSIPNWIFLAHLPRISAHEREYQMFFV